MRHRNDPGGRKHTILSQKSSSSSDEAENGQQIDFNRIDCNSQVPSTPGRTADATPSFRIPRERDLFDGIAIPMKTYRQPWRLSLRHRLLRRCLHVWIACTGLNIWSRCVRLGQRHPLWIGLLSLLLVIQIVYNPLNGSRVDRILTSIVMDQTHAAIRQRLAEQYGIKVPALRSDLTPANDMVTHAALIQLLNRRQARHQLLQNLELAASETIVETAVETKTNVQQQPKPRIYRIPSVLFLPNRFPFYPPRPVMMKHHFKNSFVWMDETEMRQSIVQQIQTMVEGYSFSFSLDWLIAALDNPVTFPSSSWVLSLLWAICILYRYGGVSVLDSLILTQWSDVSANLDPLFPVTEQNFTQPTSIWFYQTQDVGSSKIQLFAATPRHPYVLCILGHILEQISLSFQVKNQSLVGRHWTEWTENGIELAIFRSLQHGNVQNTSLDKVISTLSCVNQLQDDFVNHEGCCHKLHGSVQQNINEFQTPGNSSFVHYNVKVNVPISGSSVDQTGIVSVSVIESPSRPSVDRAAEAKHSLQLSLQKMGALPGWLCQRCLNWAWMGTFGKCTVFCPSAYQQAICDVSSKDHEAADYARIEVMVRRGRSQGQSLFVKRIPRIIHQIWWEDLSLDRYPHLGRLQQSWRLSGWDYRFYNQKSARQYIVDHFPARFVEAFDTLLHGAYQADLFRYLILMKEGGVYADADMELNVSLDMWIPPHLSFFAARDIPTEYAGVSSFCLVNGFMGAAPGHPFLIRAVERLLMLVEQRADLYDMERDVCTRRQRQLSGKATDLDDLEIWKIRAQPLLFLSGPCGLGVAVNEALGRPSLQGHDIGWIGLHNFSFEAEEKIDLGDALILVGDKHDLGAFRISDPDRGMILASTDFDGLYKAPLQWSVSDAKVTTVGSKEPPHYSESKRGVSIWGSSNVYRDNVVGLLARVKVLYTNDVSSE